MTRLVAEAVSVEESCSVSFNIEVRSERESFHKVAQLQDFLEVVPLVLSPLWVVFAAVALFLLLTTTGYLMFTYLLAR